MQVSHIYKFFRYSVYIDAFNELDPLHLYYFLNLNVQSLNQLVRNLEVGQVDLELPLYVSDVSH